MVGFIIQRWGHGYHLNNKCTMDFNKEVKNRLCPFLKSEGFNIIEEYNNTIKIESERVEISVNHDNRENSNSFFIGLKGCILYQINDDVLKHLFNSNLVFELNSVDTFINSLDVFLKGDGYRLLSGDRNIHGLLEEYIQNLSDNYTQNLLISQKINSANNAWNSSNYNDFLCFLNGVDENLLPTNIKQKIKIAKQKISINR